MPTPITVYADRCESKSVTKSSAIGAPLVFGGAVCQSGVNGIITAASRLRMLQVSEVKIQAQVRADATLRIICPPANAASHIRTQIKYFVNSGPIAPPEGYLSLQSLQSLRGGQLGRSLSGERLMKDDTIPVFFEIEGQKLATLQATFTAKQKNVAEGITPLMISKNGGEIELSAPSIDPETGIERLTGNFSIASSDTSKFPEREIEFGYRFVLSNGSGRNYTIEAGTLTVYSP